MVGWLGWVMWGHVVRVRWKGDQGRGSQPRINVLTQHGFRAEWGCWKTDVFGVRPVRV